MTKLATTTALTVPILMFQRLTSGRYREGVLERGLKAKA